MTKKIKRKEINSLIRAMVSLTADRSKNIISLRCERIAKEINKISVELNNKIAEIDEEYASTDKDHNLMREEVITTEQGISRKENSGIFKYTFKKSQDRKKAIEEFWDGTADIPTSIVKRTEQNKDLYKKIIEEQSFTNLSLLSGIILDLPTDKDGFIDEEWILSFLAGDTKPETNGQTSQPEIEAANIPSAE